MTPINYLEFSDYDNLIFEFNHRNILEKVFPSLYRLSYYRLLTSPFPFNYGFYKKKMVRLVSPSKNRNNQKIF